MFSWRHLSFTKREGFVLVFMASALLITRWMRLHFPGAQGSLLLCSIALSARIGGTRSGIFAVVLSIIAFDNRFAPPGHSLFIDAADAPRLIIFSMTGLFIGTLGVAQNNATKTLRRTHDKLVATLGELKEANTALQLENTERKQVQEQLAWSEAFLTEGQKISHTGSWRWNLSLGRLIWSDEQFRIFGYEVQAQAPSIESITKRIHSDDRDELRRIVQKAVSQWERFECEYRVVYPDGTLKYVQGVGCPVLQDLHGSREYIGTTVDITARRQAEEVLRKSEREFRTLAENSPDEVIRYDMNCHRIYVNPAFVRSRGTDAEQVLNQPLEVHWGADIPVDRFKEILRQVLQTGTPHQLVGIWTTGPGMPLHFALHIVAERNGNGEIISALAIGRNITSLKIAQQRLEESRLLLRQLAGRSESVREEERKHLARELHDELGQYLLALRMHISLLSIEYGGSNHALEAKAQSMIGLVDSTIKTVRNVMTTLRPVELDMGILAALEWLVGEFVKQTGVPCELHSDVTEILLCERSTTAIFRIAQEALRNVGRHADATKAEVCFKQQDGDYILEVRDNGMGFDPSVKTSGSFGLVGIRERVLMLDGEVSITTALGEGSTIRVHVPVSAVPQY
ncbi:PAS domain S-box protein [Burkholderia sp. L27(2015)]|uniref:PAS domain S-box protein n=1 Tax=Burkholderia sp. L27(2015) TaxID=1641858 RepID=UPI00131BBBA5|nr:PAS domain S-box protein [Burkholderia sp. L27(2015)]